MSRDTRTAAAPCSSPVPVRFADILFVDGVLDPDGQNPKHRRVVILTPNGASRTRRAPGILPPADTNYCPGEAKGSGAELAKRLQTLCPVDCFPRTAVCRRGSLGDFIAHTVWRQRLPCGHQ
jgi:hypothetical protein